MAAKRVTVPDVLASMAALAAIRKVVEQAVVPRLLAREQTFDALARDVVRFSRLVLLQSAGPSDLFVVRLRRDGIAVETLCTGLLAGTARYLGELWERDELSFTEVTLGTSRLQRILRRLAPELERRRGGRGERLHALFAVVPGAMHQFGVSMVAEFFRAEGWQVEVGSFPTVTALENELRSERHDLLGLSIACDVHLPVLAECCRLARRLPRVRPLGVLVGGGLLIGRPAVADELEIDGCATEIGEALVIAEHIVTSRQNDRMFG